MKEAEAPLEKEQYLRLKAERMQRLRVVMAVVPAMMGLVAITYSSLTNN